MKKTELPTCTLCGNKIFTQARLLTTDTGPKPFCEDADGCRRNAVKKGVSVNDVQNHTKLHLAVQAHIAAGHDQDNALQSALS